MDWLEEDKFYIKDDWDAEKGWVYEGTLTLEPHQEDIFRHCLTPDENDIFPYTTIIYSCPKKSGKTTIAAAIGAYAGEYGPPGNEAYSLANAFEHSIARAYTDIAYHARQRGIATQRSQVIWPSGAFTRAIASEAKTVAGGRQFLTLWDELWGYCRSPEPILTADLKWIMSDELQIGDKIVSFDEDSEERTYRSFKPGTIISHDILEAPTLKVSLMNGDEIIGTPVHKMLARKGKRNEVIWIELQELKPGDRLFRIIEPWDEVHSEEQGYLAAGFDGEGYLSTTQGGLRIGFSQKKNSMWYRTRAHLMQLGYNFWISRTNGGTNKDVAQTGTAQKHQALKFLGQIRPSRLLDLFKPEDAGRLIAQEYVEVVSVEANGRQDVVAMTVDEGTYIANGYADHNTSEGSRRLWAEMTPPPTVKSPLRIIVTYAGYEGESELLWDLYELGFVNGTPVPELAHLVDADGEPVCRASGRTFVYWDTEPRMPWQTDEYYQEQMTTLRPMDFLRLHRNQWVTSEEEFIPIKYWDEAAVLDGPIIYQPDSKYRQFPISIGVDAATKSDCTAVVGCYYDPERVKVGIAFHRIWTPSQTERFDLTVVEDYIKDVSKLCAINSIVYDPTQLHQAMTNLEKAGFRVVEFPQTATNMTAATHHLYDIMKGEMFETYKNDDLRAHLQFAKAEIKGRGMKLTKPHKRSKHKIDAATALAMAAYDAVKRGGVDTSETIKITSPYGDMTAVKTKVYKEEDLPEALRN